MVCRAWKLSFAAAQGVLMVIAAFGCDCPQRPGIVAYAPAYTSNLIFNPGQEMETPVVTHESSWPATFAALDLGDETEYVETIYDRQGTYWNDHDRYERRFRSVRVGANRR